MEVTIVVGAVVKAVVGGATAVVVDGVAVAVE